MTDTLWLVVIAIVALTGGMSWIILANRLSKEIRVLKSDIDTQRRTVARAQQERKEALDELWRVLGTYKKPGETIKSFEGGLPYLTKMTPAEKKWAKEWTQWNKSNRLSRKNYPW
jgi:hypothetical protein